ncbi:unnamed protein product [Cercospora beticola]|nr:unnamed protein product [Cercospora beticola]
MRIIQQDEIEESPRPRDERATTLSASVIPTGLQGIAGPLRDFRKSTIILLDPILAVNKTVATVFRRLDFIANHNVRGYDRGVWIPGSWRRNIEAKSKGFRMSALQS